jgi:chromosome segregation ATPase
MTASRIHKVVKGEALDGIAKKYHTDAKSLWKAPENKALVSKRGKPELLQPGDTIVVPPDAKAVKAASQRTDELQQGRDAALALLETLENETARIQRRIKTYVELIEFSKKSVVEVVGELKQVKADMKGWGDGVDTVATVAQITASLGQLCAKGYQATKLSGDALEKLNREVLKDVAKTKGEQLADIGIKLGSQLKDRAESPLAYVGVLADSWGKMTAPSFWANTFVQITQNKKTWSQAVATDVGEDIDTRIQEVVANFQRQLQTLQRKLTEVRAQQAENAKLIAECQARIRWVEAEARKP